MIDQKWTLAKWHAPRPPDGILRTPYWRTTGLDRQENVEMIAYANVGMAVKTISKKTKVSESTVRYRLKFWGIHIRDFREGRGPVAALIFKNVGNRIAQTSMQMVREKEHETSHGRQ